MNTEKKLNLSGYVAGVGYSAVDGSYTPLIHLYPGGDRNPDIVWIGDNHLNVIDAMNSATEHLRENFSQPSQSDLWMGLVEIVTRAKQCGNILALTSSEEWGNAIKLITRWEM